MSTISLRIEDLAALASLAKDLNFDDDERRCALLENGSRDFNAVPGSGKTSLLAAKLLLLAKKWPHARRGICVLSHTNVARDEIAQRLSETTEGAQLLTVASMKGETHSASLVLESYGGISRKCDVALGLEYIAGMSSVAVFPSRHWL